ncbi:MAG: hypothetical protein ABEK29_03735, partial [Bradymonadaceae bacterium]
SGGLPIQWDVPEGWTETQPSSRMRETQFRLPGTGEAGPATMAVFHFGGQAGGGPIQANIDRWVKQFQGPDGKLGREAADISTNTVRGLKVHLVDIAGTYVGMGRSKPKQNQRMLGAIVEADGGLVVFKLVGPKPTVSDHHEEFRQFVDSFRPTG